MGNTEICESCAQPESCFGNGCFGEKARGARFGRYQAKFQIPGGLTYRELEKKTIEEAKLTGLELQRKT
jgi:hypothetical protein